MNVKKRIFLIVFGLLISTGINAKANCNTCESDSVINVNASEGLSYASEQRYPQTMIYNIVNDFLERENDRTKKVLVLGYDGFREDALDTLTNQEQSAVKKLMETGGLYHSYAGADGMQETSTAPG